MNAELLFKTKIVHLVLIGKPEEALELLSQHYGVAVPKLRVGLPRGHRKNLGCYVAKNRTIYVSNREGLRSPYLIVHEFYHHLRTHGKEHKGSEKHARRFAEEYLRAYELLGSLSR